ncbi:MAG: ABC transporter ATP-binding protein [Kiritimatiellae bacterium]|nr:ABC transporter ATP-binding protein [Kiritimatiellia bacterium]
MEYVIETKDLVKRYGHRRALDGLSLKVPFGSVLGLVGPNGAGKTTWMMTVAGFILPTSGDIDILGQGPFTAERHSGRLSILPQDSDLPLESHPTDLLIHYGRLQGLPAREAVRSADEILRAVNLADRAHMPIRALSHGMRKRVMIAQCFIGYPEVVLLDEPLSGLDPREVARMRDFLLARRGRVTVVISSHNLNEIETLCTHVAFVEKGRVERFEALERLTQASSRLVYRLARPLADLGALRQLLPEALFESSEADKTLICSFDETREQVETVNRVVVPYLLEQSGLLAIERGSSLEQAYLRAEKKN